MTPRPNPPPSARHEVKRMLTLKRKNSSIRGNTGVLPPRVVALIRERQRRLAAIPRYDRYIAQAAGHLTLQGHWRTLKRQGLENARRVEERHGREIAQRGWSARTRREAAA